MIKSNQKGYVITIVLIVFAVLIGLLIFPIKFPSQDYSFTGGTNYCREFVTDPNPPTFEDGGIVYKLIKQNVPVDKSKLEGNHHVGYEGNIQVDGKNYQILNPENGAGRSYDFNTEDGITDITFSDYGLRYLLHLDSATPEEIEIQQAGLQVIDIYQDVSKPPLPLADNILKCIDEGVTTVVTPKVLVPNQSPSPDKDELQLEWFIIKQARLLPKAWWTPECKPAVYLYPKDKQLVNVRVYPKGELSYTDPPYDPIRGWTVEAYSNGTLFNSHNSSPITHNYLYYESKLLDSEIEKPTKGWSVRYDQMEGLLNNILPQLGLNQKEAGDFKEYWLNKLPSSPYYFVGLVDKNQRDYLEPLSVTPIPDTSIRFSLYFEMKDGSVEVEEPIIQTPKRNGFTLVDWGGMVKLHPGTEFTCSQ